MRIKSDINFKRTLNLNMRMDEVHFFQKRKNIWCFRTGFEIEE